MTEIRERTYNQDEKVDVDGVTFIDCTFNGATFRYAGGEHPSFENCTFNGMNWYFTGEALRTIQLLQQINNTGAAGSMIEELFKPGAYIGEAADAEAAAAES